MSFDVSRTQADLKPGPMPESDREYSSRERKAGVAEEEDAPGVWECTHEFDPRDQKNNGQRRKQEARDRLSASLRKWSVRCGRNRGRFGVGGSGAGWRKVTGMKIALRFVEFLATVWAQHRRLRSCQEYTRRSGRKQTWARDRSIPPVGLAFRRRVRPQGLRCQSLSLTPLPAGDSILYFGTSPTLCMKDP